MNNLGFLQILTLVFITLKLTEVIAWSWWLVLSPMLFALIIIILATVAIIIWGDN